MSHNPFNSLKKLQTDKLSDYKSQDYYAQLLRKSKTPESGKLEFMWPNKLLKTELSHKEGKIYQNRKRSEIKKQSEISNSELNEDIKTLLHKIIKIREDIIPKRKNFGSLENVNFSDSCDYQIKIIEAEEKARNKIFISMGDIEANFEF
mmetsp:Transcript_9011/g.10181  ORF Transcript_9011/g.10181 Transcript_9011/m.10181 type:complete len:149 (+) Transcript_9011:122-568(+)